MSGGGCSVLEKLSLPLVKHRRENVVLVAQIRNGLAFNQMLAKDCDLLLSVGNRQLPTLGGGGHFRELRQSPTVFTRHTESPPKTEAAALRLVMNPYSKTAVELTR